MPKKRRKIKSKVRSRVRGKKKGSWKKLKISYKIKRKLRLLLMAVVVVISTVVVLALISLWQFFRTPFAEAAGSYGQKSAFRGDRRYNLVLIMLEERNNPRSYIKSVSLLSLDGPGKTVSLISIPTQVGVPASGDFGEVRIESLYALGEVHKPKMNTDMVTKSISSALSVPVDGYILTDEEGVARLSLILGEEILSDNIEAIFSFRQLSNVLGVFNTLREVVRTNLSMSDGFRIISFLTRVRSDKIRVIKLKSEDFENTIFMDEKIRQAVIDEKIFDERLKVQVLNGTNKAGLAAKGARLVENLGGTVLNVGNFGDQNQEVSFIITKQPTSYSLKRFSQILKIEDIRQQGVGIGERADITIILGLDIQDEL